MNKQVESARIILRNKLLIPLIKNNMNKKLINKDFTIISNNCWGGTIYELYNLRNQTPTVGMFIMPRDYIKFLKNLRFYLNQSLVFIRCDESKWKTELEKKSNWGTYLIGQLHDIELHMLHYSNKNVALGKWNDRIQRINFERLIVKFNDQNGCTLEDINEFLLLPYKNKICFVTNPIMELSDEVIRVKQLGPLSDGIAASREPLFAAKHLHITDYLN